MQHLFLTFSTCRDYQLLMPAFTAENAAEMGRRSAALRKQREIEREFARLNPAPLPVINEAEPDRFSTDLTCVCVETLELIRKAKEPIHRAQLARALRDLRETWHLATGKPRPGLTRPEMGKSTRTQMPRVYPGVYNPPGGNIGNPGSTT